MSTRKSKIIFLYLREESQESVKATKDKTLIRQKEHTHGNIGHLDNAPNENLVHNTKYVFDSWVLLKGNTDVIRVCKLSFSLFFLIIYV